MTTDTVGGVWTFTQELAIELLQRRHSVALISFGGEPSATQHAWVAAIAGQYADQFSFEACSIPLEWMPNNEQAYIGGEELLLKLCRLLQPDCLLLSQFCFGALPVSNPKIVVAHSDVLSWSDAVNVSLSDDQGWLTRYSRLVQQGLAGSQVVVAPTASMMSDLCRNYSVPAHRAVILNGRSIAPAEKFPTRRMQTITAGRMWDKAKGLELLQSVCSPMPMYVAGEARAAASVPASPILIGEKDQPQLFDIFRMSAIYVCTSVYEPFGLAPLEAALCGCAVLARNIPSLREVWGSGARYFNDDRELSDLLNLLYTEEDVLARLQRDSFCKAQTYTADRMADCYIHLIEAALAERGQADAA